MLQSTEKLMLPQNSEVVPSSSSSVCSSPTPPPSRPSTPSSETHIESSDIEVIEKEELQSPTGEVAVTPPSPPIISTADINVSPPSADITIEGFLDHLLEVTKHVVDVDRLVQSARTSFRLIESQYEEISR
jgi:hypothetical protein